MALGRAFPGRSARDGAGARALSLCFVMGRCGARDGARPRFTVGDGGGARSVTDRPVPRDGQFLLRR